MKKIYTIFIIVCLSLFTIIVAINKKPDSYVALRKVHLNDLSIDMLNFKKKEEVISRLLVKKEKLKDEIARDIIDKKASNIYGINYKSTWTKDDYIEELNEKDSIKCIEATILSPFSEEYNYIIDTTALFFIVNNSENQPLIISKPEVYSRAFSNSHDIDYITSATKSDISRDYKKLYISSKGKFIKKYISFLKKVEEKSTEEKTTIMVVDMNKEL